MPSVAQNYSDLRASFYKQETYFGFYRIPKLLYIWLVYFYVQYVLNVLAQNVSFSCVSAPILLQAFEDANFFTTCSHTF